MRTPSKAMCPAGKTEVVAPPPAPDAWELSANKAPDVPKSDNHGLHADDDKVPSSVAPPDSWEDEGAAEVIVATVARQQAHSVPTPKQATPSLMPSDELMHCEPFLLLNMSRFCEGVPGGEAAAPAVLRQVQALLLGPQAQDKAHQLLQHGYAIYSHSARASDDLAYLGASTGEAWAQVHFAPRLLWRQAVSDAAASMPLSAVYEPSAATDAAEQTAAGAGQHTGRAGGYASDDSRGGGSSDDDTGPPAHVATAATAWAVLTAPHAEPWAVVDAVRWLAERGGGGLRDRAAIVQRVTDLAEQEAAALDERVNAHAGAVLSAWQTALSTAEGVLAHAAVAQRLQGARKQLAHIRATAGAAGSAVTQGPLASVLGDAAADEAALQQQADRAARALVGAKVAFVKAAAQLASSLQQHSLPVWALELLVAGRWADDGGAVEPEDLAEVASCLGAARALEHETAPGEARGGVASQVMLHPPVGWPPAYRDAAALCCVQLQKQEHRLQAAAAQEEEAAQLASPLAQAVQALLRGSWRLQAGDTPRQAVLRQVVALGRVMWLWAQQFGRVPGDSAVAAAATTPTSPVELNARQSSAPEAAVAVEQASMPAQPPAELASTSTPAQPPAVVLRGRTATAASRVRTKPPTAASCTPGDVAAAAMLAGAGLHLAAPVERAGAGIGPGAAAGATEGDMWGGGAMAARGSLFALAELQGEGHN